MLDPDTIQSLISIITVLIAVVALYVSYKAIKRDFNNSKSQIFLDCLQKYLDIRKDMAIARMENKEDLCEDYYRELFDLFWMEYKLWEDGYIDDNMMKAWMEDKSREYAGEKKYLADGGGIKGVTYQYCWDKVIDENYFGNDSFVEFMAYVHKGDINKALKMRGELERLHRKVILIVGKKR